MLTYPTSHAVISVLISLAAALIWPHVPDLPDVYPWQWLAGAGFYLVREVWQRTQLGYWDKAGILWGVAPTAFITLALYLGGDAFRFI
jgi:hypothetical protein